METPFRVPDGPIKQDTCDYCFLDKFNESGLFLCLHCDCVVCREHARIHSEKTGHVYFVVKKYRRRSDVEASHESEGGRDPTAMEIAIAISQQNNESDYEAVSEIIEINHGPISQSEAQSNPLLSVSAAVVSAAPPQRYITKLHDWQKQDSQERVMCHHWKELVSQRMTENTLNTSLPRIDRESSCCGECDLGENLWLCLTCGHLGCGREQMGCRGHSHGLAHFTATGHPLAVKLGTIGNGSKPDIYCYTCDDSVEPSNPTEMTLVLGPFGLSMEGKATEKTTAEIEVANSLKLALVSALEGGENLPVIRGPGFRGILNVGSTCFASAGVQAILAGLMALGKLPSFDEYQSHIESCRHSPRECLKCQELRMLFALSSSNWFGIEQPEKHILPDCGDLIPLACPSFATEEERGRQQDSAEFILNWSGRSSIMGPVGTVRKEVRCTSCDGCCLSLEPMERIIQVPLQGQPEWVSLERLVCDAFEAQISEGRNCAFCHHKSGVGDCLVSSKLSIHEAPELLFIQPLRAILGADWQPKKLDTRITVPQLLDLSGCVTGETKPGSDAMWQVRLSEAMQEGETAPHTAQGPGGVDPDALAMMLSLEMADIDTCSRLLQAYSNNVEAAVEALLSGNIPPSSTQVTQTSPSGQGFVSDFDAISAQFKEQESLRLAHYPPENLLYSFVAAVVHQGSNTSCGHYVCIVRPEHEHFSHTVPCEEIEPFTEEQREAFEFAQHHPDQSWVVMNDMKVAVTPNPPVSLAHLYVYKKI